jgi:kelch-like protein 10
MLSSCERYSLESQEWKVIEPLQKAKCAFAASAVNNEYIFVFGGFDGRERLNTIERYSAKDNKWVTIETKFKNGFSNAASVSHSENKILILGGGSNQGFTLDL